MRRIIQELCNLLTEQKGMLESLLELSHEKRQMIINGDAVRLEDVVRRELRGLSKLNAIEKRRGATHPAISAEFGLPEGELTVSAIAHRADPDERAAITKLQTELTLLLKQHAELNAENRELINAHFEYTEAMLNLMVGAEDPLNNFYGGDGKAAQDKKRSTGFFDGSA